MPPNPRREYVARRTSRMLTRVGWEPPQTWTVPRPGREPLVFQTRLPAAEFVTPQDLSPAERQAPASVGRGTIALAEAVDVAGVFLAAAIRSTSEAHGVLATMTAALTPRPFPFAGRDGAEAARAQRRKLKNVDGKVTVIERADGDLTVQYAVRTRYGVLTMTFHADGGDDTDMTGDTGRRLFLNIVRGAYLGTRPLQPEARRPRPR